MNILENETLEELPIIQKSIFQKKDGFRFTIDSILLVNFLKLKTNSTLLDIGTGTGIMPLLLSNNANIQKLCAVEIVEEIYDMFQRCLEYNKLVDKIDLFHSDIKDFKVKEPFDYIISNPPYMRLSDGFVSPSDYRATARHEVKLNLKDLLINSKRLLKNGGSLNLIYRSDRFLELITEAKDLNLNPKRIRFIHTKKDNESNLFMIELIKGFKTSCAILSPLCIYDTNGEYTEEVKNYYNI